MTVLPGGSVAVELELAVRFMVRTYWIFKNRDMEGRSHI
jgi:hypothetical protein